ncbi:hypothetical protein NN561_015846 [Cricetulus griseus]
MSDSAAEQERGGAGCEGAAAGPSLPQQPGPAASPSPLLPVQRRGAPARLLAGRSAAFLTLARVAPGPRRHGESLLLAPFEAAAQEAAEAAEQDDETPDEPEAGEAREERVGALGHHHGCGAGGGSSAASLDAGILGVAPGPRHAPRCRQRHLGACGRGLPAAGLNGRACRPGATLVPAPFHGAGRRGPASPGAASDLRGRHGAQRGSPGSWVTPGLHPRPAQGRGCLLGGNPRTPWGPATLGVLLRRLQPRGSRLVPTELLALALTPTLDVIRQAHPDWPEERCSLQCTPFVVAPPPAPPAAVGEGASPPRSRVAGERNPVAVATVSKRTGGGSRPARAPSLTGAPSPPSFPPVWAGGGAAHCPGRGPGGVTGLKL